MKYEKKKHYVPTGVYFTCTKCNEVKDVSEFPPDKRAKKGHTSRCRSCAREHSRVARKLGGIPVNRTNENKKNIIRLAKSQPCVDCNLAYPYYVMDLDHLPEFEKSFNLGQSHNYSIDQVREEIAKCEPVCANCHRIRTAKRLGMV